AGHTVTGWNPNRDKAGPLVKAGMRLADSPRAGAQVSEGGVSIVNEAGAVRSLAPGDGGGIARLKAPGGHIDTSTTAPDGRRAMAAQFAEKGLAMLDAPISGSPVTLAQGNASIMVGGDKTAFERVKDVLQAIGPKVTHIGASGLAVQMKISVNLLLMVEVIAF